MIDQRIAEQKEGFVVVVLFILQSLPLVRLVSIVEQRASWSCERERAVE